MKNGRTWLLIGAAALSLCAVPLAARAQEEEFVEEEAVAPIEFEETDAPAEAVPEEAVPGEAVPEEGATVESAVVGAAEGQDVAEVTVSPELQQVQELQRGIDTSDPGNNMRSRMDAGAKVPLTVIGEGASEAPQVYIVKPGDTLWDISARFLNDPFLWIRIHADNPQVINPDLIYPGEPVTVYPRDYDAARVRVVQLLPPPDLERAEEAAPTEEELAPVEFEEIEEVEPSAQELAEREKFLQQLTKKEEVQVFDEAATELISRKRAVLARKHRNVLEYKRAEAAGWMEFMESSDLNKAGYILGQEDAKARLRAASGDLVFINRGEVNGVAAGDRFTIFRIGEEVEHPKSGDYVGNKILIVGMLQVEAVYERTSAARIIEAYEDVSVGNKQLAGLESYDRIIPQITVEKDIRLKPNDQDVEGVVLVARDRKLSIATDDVVYIDRGTQDGVEVGNVFEIYRPNRKVDDPEVGDEVQLPRFYVGELVVIGTKEKTATAVVIRSRREVQAGDEITVARIELESEEGDTPQASAR